MRREYSEETIYCVVKIFRSYFTDDYVQDNYSIDNIFRSKQSAIDSLSYGSCLTPLSDCQDCPGLEDIRGNIINERGDIYGYIDDNGNAHYISIVEMMNDRRNDFIKATNGISKSKKIINE